MSESVTGQNLVKSSVQRGIRGATAAAAVRSVRRRALATRLDRLRQRAWGRHDARLSTVHARERHSSVLRVRAAATLGEQFPQLEEGGVLDELIPKKDKMVIAKWCAGCESQARASGPENLTACCRWMRAAPAIAARTT